jgi:transposase
LSRVLSSKTFEEVSMAKRRLSMRKIKEVLRLKWDRKLSNRQIAKSCSISHSTVADYLLRAKLASLSWPLDPERDDTALENLLFPVSQERVCADYRTPDMGYLYRELKRKSVTLQLLWYEYKQGNPHGYQYSQFCNLYRQWVKKLDLTLRQEHRAGEKVFVDYAGQTVPIVDPGTNEIRDAQVFLAALGASSYTFAEASLAQDLPSWMDAHVHAFQFFQGVPEIIVPDYVPRNIIRLMCPSRICSLGLKIPLNVWRSA